ncbi:MAG TPA: hypothetical protein VJH70_02150 [Candidatus Paceibacterota bacterium]
MSFEQPMVVPKLSKEKDVKIEDVYVSVQKISNLFSRIRSFLTPPETLKKETPISDKLVVQKAVTQQIENQEEKPPAHTELIKYPEPRRVIDMLPHLNFESVLGEEIPERKLIAPELISSKTQEIYMKRLAGRESGYTYQEIDEILKMRGLRPNTQRAHDFMERWDKEHAERLLYNEFAIEKKKKK